jgi:hypothetical protein
VNSREYSKHLKFHVNMLATNFFLFSNAHSPKEKKSTVRRRCRCPLRFSLSPTKYGESIPFAWREHTVVSVTGGDDVAMLSIRRAAALQFMGLRLVLLARDDDVNAAEIINRRIMLCRLVGARSVRSRDRCAPFFDSVCYIASLTGSL